MRRERVSKTMRMNGLRDSGAAAGLANALLEVALIQMMPLNPAAARVG
jgi:hypothetical protein